MKHSLESQKLRRKYLNELSEVPIFHPKVRFERYEQLYNLSLQDDDKRGMADALSLTQNEFAKRIGGDTYNQMFFINQGVDMTLEEIKARKEYWLNKLKSDKPKEITMEVTDGPDRPSEG